MSGRDDGGAAFPGPRREQVDEQTIDGAPVAYYADVSYPGMSLRDWFAGQALAGMIANPNTPDQLIGSGWTGSKNMLAEYAYAAADAMLAERSKP